MFRSAVVKSSTAAAARRSASLVATRSLSSIVSRPAALRVNNVAKPAASVAAWKVGGIRGYAGGSGLTKEDVEGRITSLLAGFDKVNDTSNITSTAHFANDLGLDSLDTVEVVMAIEEEFSIEIPDKDADKIHSVEQAVQYILSQPDAH